MTFISRTTAAVASPAEQEWVARLGGWLFRHRGILPVPFIVVPFVCIKLIDMLLVALGLA